MKVYAEKQEEPFNPIKLTLEFNSLAEVREFYSIFNTARITNRLKYTDHDKIRESLRNISPKFTANALEMFYNY